MDRSRRHRRLGPTRLRGKPACHELLRRDHLGNRTHFQPHQDRGTLKAETVVKFQVKVTVNNDINTGSSKFVNLSTNGITGAVTAPTQLLPALNTSQTRTFQITLTVTPDDYTPTGIVATSSISVGSQQTVGRVVVSNIEGTVPLGEQFSSGAANLTWP